MSPFTFFFRYFGKHADVKDLTHIMCAPPQKGPFGPNYLLATLLLWLFHPHLDFPAQNSVFR